eukprot:11740498-Karenia_brevis.AAC.1
MRAGQIRTEAKALSKHVLRNSSLSVKTKVCVIQPHIFSAGFYNASTWPKIKSKALAKLHHAVLDVYKCLCTDGEVSPDDYYTDDQ